MVYQRDDLDARLKRLFESILPPGSSPQVESLPDGDHLLVLAGEQYLVRTITRGDLRTARLAIEREPTPHLVAARHLSGSARSAITDAGVGWVDETGGARFKAGPIILALDGTASPPPRPSPTSEWFTSYLAAAEALLAGAKATGDAVAKAAALSPASALRALSFLAARGLVEASAARGRASGRQLVDPGRLLEEFADAVARRSQPAALHCAVLWRDPATEVATLGTRWSEQGLAWAAGGALAASVEAPYLSQVTRGVVYVDAGSRFGLLSAANAAGLEPMPGGRLLLARFPTSATRELRREVGGLSVTSWPRTYADLRGEGVRGQEAAEHLREVVCAS